MEGDAEDSTRNDTLVHGNDEDCEDGEDQRSVEHAEVEPDPAAVVGCEVKGFLIADSSSAVLVLLDVAESADDTVASESLVHV